MDQEKRPESVLEIDIFRLLRALLRNIFIIILAMIICGGLMLAYSRRNYSPLYRTTAMLYVNTRTFSVGSTSIAIGSVNVSTSTLVDLYSVILKSRTTLEEVIEKAELPYSYSALKGMISTNTVDYTGIFEITATCSDPGRAKLIVDTIVDVLPKRIMEILDGSSVRIVDYAVRPTYPINSVGNSYMTRGFLIGFVLSCGIIILLELLDNTVKDEKYLTDTYHLPVLAVIPDNNTHGGGGYGKYGRYGHYGKYYTKNYQYYTDSGSQKSKQNAKK